MRNSGKVGELVKFFDRPAQLVARNLVNGQLIVTNHDGSERLMIKKAQGWPLDERGVWKEAATMSPGEVLVGWRRANILTFVCQGGGLVQIQEAIDLSTGATLNASGISQKLLGQTKAMTGAKGHLLLQQTGADQPDCLQLTITFRPE